MSLIVQKFGGSSVADANKLRNVARIITDTYQRGNDVVVVLSAQGDTTTLFPLRYVSVMIRATFRMRAVSATELPPNFCTINAIYLFPPKGQFSISAQDSAHHSMPAAFLTPAPG